MTASKRLTELKRRQAGDLARRPRHITAERMRTAAPFDTLTALFYDRWLREVVHPELVGESMAYCIVVRMDP